MTLVRACAAGALATGLVLALMFWPDKPTRSLRITTEELPILLPHAHGLEDKISDGHHGVNLSSLPVEFPESMWVTEISLVTKNAPPSIVHHAHIIRVLPDGTRDPLENLILTFGQDAVPTVRIPAPAGILFNEGDRIAIDAVLHNPVPPLGEGGVYKDVSVEATVSGFGTDEGRYAKAQFRLVRVTDSVRADDDDSTFAVPVGEAPYVRSSDANPPGTGTASSFRFPDDGWIVFMGAHMHAWEGGQRVDAYLNNERIRTFSSRLLDEQIPWSFQTPASPTFVRVKQGDVFSVAATYLNAHDAPIVGAMGMVGIYFVRDQFSLGSPLYLFEWMLRSLAGKANGAILAPFE